MKKQLAGILALAVSLTMAACNSDTDSGEAPANETTTTAAAAGDETTAKANEDSAEEETTEAETEPPAPAVEYVEPAAEDFEYSYDAALGGVKVTKYKGEAEAIIIPTELDGDPVKEIKLDSSKITHVEIPDGVTEISDGEFKGCKNLESIVIPDSVLEIGKSAFSGSGLTQITLPDNGVKIHEEAFSSCESLESITIPDSVKFVVDGLSYNEETGTVEDTQFIRFSGTFNGCKNLKEVTIPSSITSIGESAFRYCESLANITIPDGVTYIGDEAFNNCTSLTDITIPGSVTSIGEKVFQSCKSLTDVTISEGVTCINERMFSGCINLTNVTIPDSVKLIGTDAFSNCSNLRSLTLPDSIELIDDAFDNCNALTVTYKGKEYNYTNFDDLDNVYSTGMGGYMNNGISYANAKWYEIKISTFGIAYRYFPELDMWIDSDKNEVSDPFMQ